MKTGQIVIPKYLYIIVSSGAPSFVNLRFIISLSNWQPTCSVLLTANNYYLHQNQRKAMQTKNLKMIPYVFHLTVIRIMKARQTTVLMKNRTNRSNRSILKDSASYTTDMTVICF